MKQMTIVLMGKSGAGKGTQVKKLLNLLEDEPVINVETGKLFREFIQKDTFAAFNSKKIMEAGLRQPDYLAVVMWGSFLMETIKTNKEHILIDGFPRSYSEAKMVETMFNHFGRINPIFFYLDVSDEEATERMFRRGRSDDNEKDIKTRLGWFKKDVIPAINFFKKKNEYTFIKINGEQSPENVHMEIIDNLQY